MLPRKAAEINDPSVQKALEIGRRELERFARRKLGLNGTELSVYLEIVDEFANSKTHFAWPSVKKILGNLEESRRTQVETALSVLRELGLLIKVDALHEGRKRKVYVLGAPEFLSWPKERSAERRELLRRARQKTRNTGDSENPENRAFSDDDEGTAESAKTRNSGTETPGIPGVIKNIGNGTSVAASRQLHDTGSDSELFITASDGTRVRASRLEEYEAQLDTIESYDH